MPRNEAVQPAQVPGDAESPARGQPDPTAKRAILHSDKTEAEQSAQNAPHREAS